ncbi:hypothetical protein [Paraburkholderia sp. CNPSo 3076]|uniref:hypothetical protein n=1 Tax=Paraburkholderia sp. CNPSo 3076 TaxID=2940936 RepID=UPI002B1D6BE5|nr:hypothetical protein [Paraburkholderia sp. CNPSo 3076]
MPHSPITILIFTQARSQNGWLDRPVSDEQLGARYEHLKGGPTSVNCSPARFVFLRTSAAKEILKPALAPGNVEKTLSAPGVLIDGRLLAGHAAAWLVASNTSFTLAA